MALPPSLALSNPISDWISTSILGKIPATPPFDPQTVPNLALAGIFSTGVGFAYLLSLYHGFDTFIYTSVPGRLGVAATGLVMCMIRPTVLSPLLVTVILWDGLGALLMGYLLGAWTGSPPGEELGKAVKRA
jgi:hypothetical protein